MAQQGWKHVGETGNYDEDEQANCIWLYLESFKGLNIDGIFLHQFVELPVERGYGIAHPYGIALSRKKAFYMYKSYERAT